MRNIAMENISYHAFRQHLKSFLDKVISSRSPLIVKRADGEDIVVLSKSDYNSMQETFYLLRNPVNAQRLLKSIEECEKGQGQERKLIER
jgi:antitoxin YefM